MPPVFAWRQNGDSMLRTVYMLNAWGMIQEELEGGKFGQFVFENNEIKIIYPYVKRFAGTVHGKDYYDLVTPRGECGPFIEKGEENIGNHIRGFSNALKAYCADENIIAEYVKFDPWNNNREFCKDIYHIETHGQNFSIPLQEDFLYTQIHADKRNQIRRAAKKGAKVELEASWDRIQEFLDVYRFTVEKNNVSSYYFLNAEYLEKYKRLLGDKAMLSFGYLDGRTAACALTVATEDVCNGIFCASDPACGNINVMSLLYYNIAVYYSNKGCKYMDMGGAIDGSGLERFKKTFVSEEQWHKCYIGTAIRNKEIYDKLVEQRGGPHIGYFPEYR